MFDGNAGFKIAAIASDLFSAMYVEVFVWN